MNSRARRLAHWLALAMVRVLPRAFLRVLEAELDRELMRVAIWRG
jgi:hypothetical protein